jgi:IclR family transcriptional regulator, pca regulon regulatory protein
MQKLRHKLTEIFRVSLLFFPKSRERSSATSSSGCIYKRMCSQGAESGVARTGADEERFAVMLASRVAHQAVVKARAGLAASKVSTKKQNGLGSAANFMKIHMVSDRMNTLATNRPAALELFAGDPDFMASLAKGLIVLEALSSLSGLPTIANLSHATGLSRASVRRCLYTLSKLGYARSTKDRQHELWSRMIAFRTSNGLRKALTGAADSVLGTLRRKEDECFSITMLDGDEVVCIASTSLRGATEADLTVGTRLPAYCTSMGRMFLASLSSVNMEAYLARVVLNQLTPRTVTTVEGLRMILEDTRRRGYASCDQEYASKFRSLACPVQCRGRGLVATLNVSTSSEKSSIHALEKDQLSYIRFAANELASALV